MEIREQAERERVVATPVTLDGKVVPVLRTESSNKPHFSSNTSDLRVGDWVEVKSSDEILATLDDQGRLDALPFMPEMLRYCGRRFRVFKSAHKTCDTTGGTHASRRMKSAVHLERVRCDGAAHGGCQAGCLVFWKNAWLKPASGPHSTQLSSQKTTENGNKGDNTDVQCDLTRLTCATRVPAGDDGIFEERYRCQATELFRATTPLRWWDGRHYVKDLTSRNVRLQDFLYYGMIATFNVVMLFLSGLLSRPYVTRVARPAQDAEACPTHEVSRHLLRDLRHPTIDALFRLVRRCVSYIHPYPHVHGRAKSKTPIEVLSLQPGEQVRVRSKDEIMRTINRQGRNRGLWFDIEMLPYCNKVYRVEKKVERIINEKTGVMITLPGKCLVLDGVTCRGNFSKGRLFCPRSIYPFWREIWLQRVEGGGHDIRRTD